jgi:hypothetical protein
MDRYVISVEGLIPDGALTGLHGFTATPQPLHTVLQGELRDQSALAGVLDYLDELGIVILEVLTLPPELGGGSVEDL